MSCNKIYDKGLSVDINISNVNCGGETDISKFSSMIDYDGLSVMDVNGEEIQLNKGNYIILSSEPNRISDCKGPHLFTSKEIFSFTSVDTSCSKNILVSAETFCNKGDILLLISNDIIKYTHEKISDFNIAFEYLSPKYTTSYCVGGDVKEYSKFMNLDSNGDGSVTFKIIRNQVTYTIKYSITNNVVGVDLIDVSIADDSEHKNMLYDYSFINNKLIVYITRLYKIDFTDTMNIMTVDCDRVLKVKDGNCTKVINFY